jgi:hypothetical protein
MNKQIPLDAFQGNISSGSGTVICDLSKFLGSVLEKITLRMAGGAFTKAHVTGIRLRVAGKVIWESNGTRLDLSNQYLVTNSDAAVLKIDFYDRKAITSNARQAGTLDLSAESKIKTARLEVDVAGATTPSLSGIADVSKPDSSMAESAIRWLAPRRVSVTQVVGSSGWIALTVPHLNPNEGGSVFRRIYIYSANCTGLRSKREGIVEHDLTKAENEHAQKDNGRTPQSNLIVFDPVQDGQMADRVWDTRPESGVRSASLEGNFSAGETITIETEELIPVGAY